MACAGRHQHGCVIGCDVQHLYVHAVAGPYAVRGMHEMVVVRIHIVVQPGSKVSEAETKGLPSSIKSSSGSWSLRKRATYPR